MSVGSMHINTWCVSSAFFVQSDYLFAWIWGILFGWHNCWVIVQFS